METVVAAALIIILVLLSMLTLTYACISAQTGLLESWRAMDERALERSRTSLSPVGAGMEATGDVVTITLKNDGSVKLSDLRQWDVVLEYVTPTGRMAGWYPYAQAADPGQNQWAL
ncbi:MAG TPA: hypothetical protein PLJ35_10200 [Anaerolineae bacterium]|nr:hypothetical protein [Anaerolineae bacterium]HOQ99177.1 hypothetical protein [Anaerolineae bacterium]HPL30552.1 hypothetical protein [Anaerolineae bacterium]